MTTTEHTPAATALPSLYDARERFLTGRPLPDGVPEEVAAAWRRARFFGVPHDLKEPAARPERPVESALLDAARPVLDRIVPALGAGRSLLILTDERLRVLWTAGSVPGLEPCPVLSEQEVGNNSAALALRTRRRAEMHGPEHFLDRWQDVSAVTVPLLDPESAQVLGTVTVASGLCTTRSPHPQAALAEAAATAVETELRTRAGRAERVLLDAYLRATGPDGARGADLAVVALDGRNRLVSDAAQRLLTPEMLEALERTAVSVRRGDGAGGAEGTGGAECAARLGDGAGDAEGTEPGGRTARLGDGAAAGVTEPGERTRRLEDGVSGAGVSGAGVSGAGVIEAGVIEGAGCAARLTPARLDDGTVLGIVAVLEPLGDPVPSAPASPRPPATLTGSSVPWRHAVARAVELARSPEPLLLTGERGTGKSALARELLGQGPVRVADAARDTGLDGALAAWPADRPLLLRHAERLEQPGVAALNSLLDTHPDTRVLVTYTPGAQVGPCLQRLLDKLSARSVTLPPLRERTEDIRQLLPVLGPRTLPGQPPLTWTLDALRALELHPWPGNVTELAHVVRALAEQRRLSGPVRRAELPDPVREGPAARPLSPMEHAERAAILEALRRHGGNKARAAAALGIGRATLYRKLRGYRG
ncbi:helix-turn-helix domain-containing protein [Streptomyces violarus]|uniref:Transcriptional regulator of acetoin/glycerol metabolism n=1 Tax=Streptomyces violarus TaxID=67380 RepID=A0A7W5EZT9_9ACTN|nr:MULTISPECIES: helix-turn-helix domain-containing protein [Streptomyces]MBB3074704.1 transcriptional regulator of acetoin/glycerol metabolism [Streptomyces violarus]WRT97370.1 helix-turn-helix domain-containing protein [Streptomyces sp. CGMCC 4.1772]